MDMFNDHSNSEVIVNLDNSHHSKVDDMVNNHGDCEIMEKVHDYNESDSDASEMVHDHDKSAVMNMLNDHGNSDVMVKVENL